MIPREVGAKTLVAFTAQQAADEPPRYSRSETGVAWSRAVRDRAGRPLRVRVELTGPTTPLWRAILASEGSDSAHWRNTPFAEFAPFTEARKPQRTTVDLGFASNGAVPSTASVAWIWSAVAFSIEPLVEAEKADQATGAELSTLESRERDRASGAARLAIRMRISTRGAGGGGDSTRSADGRGGGMSLPESIGRARHSESANGGSGRAANGLNPDVADGLTPGRTNAWEAFFDDFPAFSCGDPHLDRYFDYRIFGLGLNRIAGDWGHVRHPAIAEGPAYFHLPITYSAQCHMMEMRWKRGGEEAWGSLLNFVENQRSDGSFHGRLYPHHLEHTDFYHANWGDALLAVDDLQPDPQRLLHCYRGLAKYARWLGAARDPEGSGMFTVLNHFETGQEYMSRYMAVDDEADIRGWEPRLHLKGIDVTVYAQRLFAALDKIAESLGLPEAEKWQHLRARTNGALDRMWSLTQRIYTDVDARTGERTGVKAAVGFYPLLAGVVRGDRLEALLAHLEDPSTFGTPFPIPSSSVDDRRFSAEGIWRGARRNCPWNGRVWPMTTSHLIEGLIRCWRSRAHGHGNRPQADTGVGASDPSAVDRLGGRGDGSRADTGTGHRRAGKLAATLLVRFVRMMFTDGRVSRPNSFEHYNPYTGRACHFRGIDDYQHSWVLDLLVRGISGLHIDAAGIAVDPLPHRFERVSLGPVASRGREISVRLDADAISLQVDDECIQGPRGRCLFHPWRRARAKRNGSPDRPLNPGSR